MNCPQSEDLYLRIFENAVVAIGVTNREGNYTKVNRAWCEFMGYSTEEALSLNVRDITPEEDRDQSDENFQKLIEGSLSSFSKKRRYQRKDGKIFWAELYVSSLHDQDGKISGVLGIFTNIDKQMQAEQLQSEMNSYLEKLSNDLENAHEAMQQKNKALTEAYKTMERLARHDTLTGLYNRRTLEEILNQEHQRFVRTGRSFSVAIADIDNFKSFNDTYGHECGDAVLKTVSKVFLSMIRTTDRVGRWGGEEFLFVFPETPCEGAIVVLERLRQKVADTMVNYDGKEHRVTITIGLSTMYKSLSIDELVREADEALYEGKKHGKNQVYSKACEVPED